LSLSGRWTAWTLLGHFFGWESIARARFVEIDRSQ